MSARSALDHVLGQVLYLLVERITRASPARVAVHYTESCLRGLENVGDVPLRVFHGGYELERHAHARRDPSVATAGRLAAVLATTAYWRRLWDLWIRYHHNCCVRRDLV